jgi:hypothetical protein
LPFIDGSRYSGKGVLAGGHIVYNDGTPDTFDKMEFTDNGNGAATVKYGDLRFELYEDGFKIISGKQFVLENRIGIDGEHLPDVVKCEDKCLSLSYKNTPYSINLKKGCFIDSAKITSEQGEIEFSFS